MASKTIHTSLVIRGYCFGALISHESMYFKNNKNVAVLLLFVVSHVVVKMAESFAAKGKKNQSCCKGAFQSQLPANRNGRFNFFTNELAVWVINCDD